MSEISVYKQLTSGTSECLAVIKNEIGLKTTCMPFAVKIVESLKTLSLRTEQEQLTAAQTLLAGLQTLWQGGIIAEDYDKIDFVKRGKTIVPSARVEAFYRASARKGYRITDDIIAVPQDDKDTTYFKENFYNGDIIYTLEDRRYNPDRAITAQRLIDKYFNKFICRFDVREVKTNKRVVMTTCEMSIDDILTVSLVSEQGIYKSHWEKYKDDRGYEKNRKVITNELNNGTFWVKWTGEMVKKTIIRRALKRIKEVLPELTDAIYAFEQDEYVEQAEETQQPQIDIPIVADDVDLKKLTASQIADCEELYNVWKTIPKLADDKLKEIKDLLEHGTDVQGIINKEYAAIVCLQRSKKKWPEIEVYFNEKNKG